MPRILATFLLGALMATPAMAQTVITNGASGNVNINTGDGNTITQNNDGQMQVITPGANIIHDGKGNMKILAPGTIVTHDATGAQVVTPDTNSDASNGAATPQTTTPAGN
jgi:hypothetical protein